MSITSGHTHICFDGTYKLKSQMVEDKELGNEQRRIIAFNDKNDIVDDIFKDNPEIK